MGLGKTGEFPLLGYLEACVDSDVNIGCLDSELADSDVDADARSYPTNYMVLEMIVSIENWEVVVYGIE